MKNKKILAIIGVAVVGIGLGINMVYSKINAAQNDFVQIEGTQYNIERAIMDDKKVLLNLQDKMMKLNENKQQSIQIDKMISDLENMDLKDESKRKEIIEQLDMINEEIDIILSMYNENDAMKKDVEISNNIIELESLDSFIDNLMEEHNMYLKKFNDVASKFPVSMVVEKNGWKNVYKFSSVE